MRHLKRLSAAAEHGITADTSASVGKHTLRHGGLIIGVSVSIVLLIFTVLCA